MSQCLNLCMQNVTPLNLKTVVSACCKSLTFAGTHLWSTYCVAAEGNPVTHSGLLTPLALCPLMHYLHSCDTTFIPKGSAPVLYLFIYIPFYTRTCLIFCPLPLPCTHPLFTYLCSFHCHKADSDQISSKFKSHKIRVWLLQFKEQSLSLALGEDLVPISRHWRPSIVVTGDSEVENPILKHYPIYLAPSLC